MNKSKSVIIATSNGLCVKVYLDLKRNYVKGMQKGAIPFLRKLGWDIGKRKGRYIKDIYELKRYRIFKHKNRIKKTGVKNG
tara:strand:+ start:239 stop:481 length:243 start_codon:yes stop_codon:yes gene_type:complete